MAGINGPEIELLDRIDAGGMAEVFRAKLKSSGGFEKIVAVKRILPHLAMDPRFRPVFEREISLISRIQHPSIVQVFHTGEQAGYLYLVMEYVSGITLNALLLKCQQNRSLIPIPLSCYVSTRVAKGLYAAYHARDASSSKELHIVHRDLNPRNIMLSYRADVKIIDFGIAKAMNQTQAEQSYGFRGTYGYCSPEQIKGEPLDNRTDIFGLGVVLWEMLAQRPLYTGEPHEIVRKVVNDQPVSPRTFRKDIPEELDFLVMRALIKDKKERLPTARDFYENLESILRDRFPAFRVEDASSFLHVLFEKEIEAEASITAASQPSLGESFFLENNPMTHSGAPRTRSTSFSFPKTRFRLLTIFALVSVLLVMCLLFWLPGPSTSPPPKNPKVAIASPVQPADLPGVIAWLDADSLQGETGTPVSRWKGNQNTQIAAVQNSMPSQPIVVRDAVAGHSVVRFDGVNDYLELNSIIPRLNTAQQLTIFWVGNTYNTNSTQYAWSSAGPDVKPMGRHGGGYSIIRAGYAKNATFRIKGNQRVLAFFDSHPGLVRSGQFDVLTAQFEHRNVYLFQNGGLVASGTTANPVELSKANSFSIGQEFDPTSSKNPNPMVSDLLHGSLAELIVAVRPLSKTEKRGVELYLSQRFQIPLVQ